MTHNLKRNLLLVTALLATAVSALGAMMNPFWNGALAVFSAFSIIAAIDFLYRYPAVNRYLPYLAILLAAGSFAVVGAMDHYWVPLFATFSVLALVGTLDLFQQRQSLWRNYPLISRVRWAIEAVRPELRQYLFESDSDGRPFSREERALVYQRAKGAIDSHPFGTELDVYSEGYEWIAHSIAPRPKPAGDLRVTIGGDQCSQPYSASVFNISAMSFGSLSANAIRALNRGAKAGSFYHDTGEGGVSRYHREFGGDLVWELGSGYFGCRADDGRFDPEKFRETASLDQIRMIEIKLSQGAKPGHGGVLPGPKVTEEIAEARGVPIGEDCISPSAHSAFDSPIGLMKFVAQLRELSGGKPVGFKLCIGDPTEFMAIAKAMLETGITPDFIVVDGAEGGTGAAPLELSNHVGMPLREGLILVQNVLVGTGLRERLHLGAAGKVTSGYGLAANLALGADWCNAARGFMFALGCVQSLSCHTDRCPTGVATQDPKRARGLVVPDKAARVASFHRHTVDALAEIVAAAGLSHPEDLEPEHLWQRVGPNQVCSAADCYEFLQPGALLGVPPERWQKRWNTARADRFGLTA